MQNKWLGILAIGAMAGGYSLAVAAPPDMDDVPLTLSGCVVAGESKDSYLLTNVVVDGTSAHTMYAASAKGIISPRLARSFTMSRNVAPGTYSIAKKYWPLASPKS